MIRYASFVLIALLVVLAVWGCSGPDSEEKLFEQAKAAQEQQNFKKALECYEKIVEINPGSARAGEAQFMVGFLYANNLNEIEKARTAYERFLEIYGESADSGLVISVQWELDHLGRDVSEIEELILKAEHKKVAEANDIVVE